MGVSHPLYWEQSCLWGFQPRHKPIMEYLTHINQQFDIRWFQDRVYPSPNHWQICGKMMIIFWNVVFQDKNTPHKELFQHYTRVFEVEDITVYTHTHHQAMNDLRLLNLQSTNLSCWKLAANPWEVNMWVQDYGSLFFMRCHFILRWSCPLYFRVHPS